MRRTTSQIPEKLVDEFVQLQDEYSKYSELSEKEVAIMKKLSKSIRVLQRAVNEVIPLSPAILSKVFPKVKEVHLRKDGTVEIVDRRGMRVTMRLEEFPPQVFVSIAREAVARLNEIIEARRSMEVRMRELIRVDFVIERIRRFLVHKDEIAHLQILNRANGPVQVALSVLKEGDWAIYRRLKLAAGEQANLDLMVLKILESPLPVKFQIRCQDPEGEDYDEIFTLGPISPGSKGLSQPIIAQEST